MEFMRPNRLKVEVLLGVSTAITASASNEYAWSYPLLNPKKEVDYSIGLTPTPLVVKLSATFSTEVIFSGKIGGSAKAEVNIAGKGISLELDLVNSRPRFNTGLWTQAGAR
eukprot:scaffold100385_cov64-Phaeocystis_antarctica.AAC.3